MVLQSWITLLTRGLARSYDKFEKLYLQYHNANGGKSWHSGYVQRRGSFHKIRKPFDHVLMQCHGTKQMCHISNIIITTDTKIGREITYNEEHPFIKFQNPLSTWSCKVMWQIYYLITLLPQCLRPLNVTRW